MPRIHVLNLTTAYDLWSVRSNFVTKPSAQPSTAQTIISVYGSNAGSSDLSVGIRIGATASVSTQWRNDTLVTCRTAHGVGFGWSVLSSVVHSQAHFTGVFSYSKAVFNVSSLESESPLTGATRLTIYGFYFGSFNPTASVTTARTACKSSSWQSSSSLMGKSGRFSKHATYEVILTVANSLSGSSLPNLMTIAQNVSVTDLQNHANTPSSGNAHAVMFGRLLGSNAFSARQRFAGSACKYTQWLSDSCIHLRVNDGVAVSTTAFVVSFNSPDALVAGSMSSALKYNTPSPTTITSQRISNLRVTGSNFGPYFVVIPRSTHCTNLTVFAFSSSFCNSSDLDTALTVTEAAVTVTFSGTSRLDDVVISLISPQQVVYTLMRNKCYGALPCGQLNSVTFKFQILPISQSILTVPVMMCPSSGTYLPEENDVISLRQVLLSHNAIGTWSLRVTSGALNQNVTSASLYFKTAILDFKIGDSTVSSLSWFSDSSVMMNAPGHQSAEGIDSSVGFGRNRPVTGLSSGLKGPSSCVYSYPDPALMNVSGASEYVSSGSTKVQLVGRYYSNANPCPRARMGFTVCAGTRWQSDTALTCIQAPAVGIVHNFALTVEKSAVARLNSAEFVVNRRNGLIDGALVFVMTAASCVTVIGAGFGNWDSSLHSRIARFSSADVTVWRSDSQVVTKLLSVNRDSLSVAISISDAVKSISSVSMSDVTIGITACNSSMREKVSAGIYQPLVASSGSNLVAVIGNGFGSMADKSLRVAFFQTSAQCSSWSSDSIVVNKSPWGFRAHNPELRISADLIKTKRTNVFNFRSSSSETLSIFNESATVMTLNGSSFSSFQIQALLKIDDRAVVTNWTSDSSIRFVYPWPVSRDVMNFLVRFTDPNGQLLSTTAPANPVFVPSSKPVNESINVKMYNGLPADVTDNLNEFMLRGTVMGWTFPTQYFSTPPSYFESELIDLDIVVYTNHTQVYLKDYNPISMNFKSNLSLYDASSNLMNHHVCFGDSSLSQSASLLASKFATLFKASFAICSLPNNSELHSVHVVATIRLLDENGALVSSSTQPLPLSIRPRPRATLSSQFADINVSAGTINTVPMIVSLTNAGASCSRLVFEYTANISCLSNQTLVPSFFVPDGLCNEGKGVSTVRQKVEKTCDIDFQSWTFEQAGSCHIAVHVLMFNTAFTVPIFVQAGAPNGMAIVGQLQSHLKAGDVIWSNNASVLKCLELSFTDKCNNSRAAGGFSCRLHAYLSNTSQYTLLGQTSVDANANGRCVWCSARVSLTAPLLVVLQVQWLDFDRYLEPLVNVSGRAEAAVLSLAAPSFNNETKAGNALAPITFKLFDANGAPAAASNTIIRVRIIRKNKPSSAAR